MRTLLRPLCLYPTCLYPGHGVTESEGWRKGINVWWGRQADRLQSRCGKARWKAPPLAPWCSSAEREFQ